MPPGKFAGESEKETAAIWVPIGVLQPWGHRESLEMSSFLIFFFFLKIIDPEAFVLILF
jgi:hypothetical protein